MKEELGCNQLDALIISGDVGNFSIKGEYQQAIEFLKKLVKNFKIKPSNIVIVPGNHDLNWDLARNTYILKDRKDIKENKLIDGQFVEISEEVVRIRQPEHPLRFRHFFEFYHEIKGEPYPHEYAKQAVFHHLQELNLLIVGFNSAWEVDEFFPNRVSISIDAVTHAINQINNNKSYENCWKFAVWHHPLNSPDDDRIRDHGFLQQLAQQNFCLCFHGHIHKDTVDQFRYDVADNGRKMDIVGAGTFGAPVKEWTPGYPLGYNLIELKERQLTVNSRCRRELTGTWNAHSIWRQGQGKSPLPHYTIELPELYKQNVPGLSQKNNGNRLPTKTNKKINVHESTYFEISDIPAHLTIRPLIWINRFLQKTEFSNIGRILANLRDRLALGVVSRIHFEAIHSIRRFAFNREFFDTSMYSYESLENLANGCRNCIADILYAHPEDIHCTIKLLEEKGNAVKEDWPVFTIARSRPYKRLAQFGRKSAHLLGHNSTFAAIAGASDRKNKWEPNVYSCFMCNDLINHYNYDCSRENWTSYYRATAVFPLRYRRISQEDYTLIGFLTFDTMLTDLFKNLPCIFHHGVQKVKYDNNLTFSSFYHIGGIMADTLTCILGPWIKLK